MSYEFGDFGEEDESVTGLKAASEKKKGRSRRSRKKKKQEVLEAGDNPMADSSDEEEPEQPEQPAEGSGKKKKKKKKKKKQRDDAHAEFGMAFDSDEEDEGISGLSPAAGKGKKEKKKKVKKGTVLEAGDNPMAESDEEEPEEAATPDTKKKKKKKKNKKKQRDDAHAEFGMAFDSDEEEDSISGLPAADKKGKKEKKKKVKKGTVLEAGDNPMAESSEEEPTEEAEPPEEPAKDKKKDKKKKKKKKQRDDAHAEFGTFGDSDEEDSVTGLPSTGKKGRKEKKKKVKKGTVLEAGDNPMAESSEEEEPAEDADAAEEEEADGPQKEKKDKKKKKGSDDDATPRSTDLDLLDLDEDSDDDATAAKIASMSKGKTPRSVRQSGASDMDFNPVADGHNEDWAKAVAEADGAEQSCEGWLLGVPVGKKKKTIVTRFVQLKGAGTSWNLLMYQDEASSSAKRKPISGMQIDMMQSVLCFDVGTVDRQQIHAVGTAAKKFHFTQPLDKDMGEVDVRTGQRKFYTLPMSSLSKFVESLMDKHLRVVDEDGDTVGIGGVAEDDITVEYGHAEPDPPNIIWEPHDNGFLRVADAFGPAAKAQGMALDLELRTVAGKKVGGLPQSLLKQRIADAEKPVEMVFIHPEESSEEEEEEEEEEESDDEDDVVDVIFNQGGSIGIVFDEGEEEDTVIIDSIKPNTPAFRFKALEPGMILKECRGQDTGPLEFDDIVELITNPRRPLEMTFGFDFEYVTDDSE